MKTAIIFLVTFFSAFAGTTQAQSFSHVAMVHTTKHDQITFKVSAEANVRHYRIEGSNDNARFCVIATVASKGNSVHAGTYSYDVSSQPYTYYRVAIVQMGGQMPYSAVLRKEAVNNDVPAIDEQPAMQSPVLVTNN